MIEVSRLEDLNAAELFLGFRVGAISRCDFAVFPVQGQRGLGRLKRYFGNKMSVGTQTVVVLKAFVEYCVSLVFAHPFEFSWLDVSQADVFHPFLFLCATSVSSVSLWWNGPTKETPRIHREHRGCTEKNSWRECLQTSGCDRACTLVIHDNDAIRADYAFRHLECRRDGALGKQPLSSAQRYRIYNQPERIDQIVLDKRDRKSVV